MENILKLKTINELQKMNFFIPSYQRGYRWGEKEVIDLLNDISDFTPKQIDDTDKKTWYCLFCCREQKSEISDFTYRSDNISYVYTKRVPTYRNYC